LKSFLVNLTAIVVFAHAVLGCCWHHSHVGIEDGGRVAETAVLAVSHTGHDAECAGEPDQRHQSKHCQEGKCDFDRPTNVKIFSATFFSPLDAAYPFTSTGTIAADEHFGGDLCTTGQYYTPLPLYLAKQVLLI
jgi:hypothetical protein